MHIFCQNFTKNERFLSILAKNQGSVLKKKWCGNFWNFEIFPPFWPENGQKLGRGLKFCHFWVKMWEKSQNFENSRTTFFNPKDFKLTKYWVYSINRAQMNWCEAFFWFKLPDPWFLVRIDKNRSFFEIFWQNMCILPKQLLFFHTHHITTSFEG